jgi:phosphoglycolate phosphatase
MGRSIQGLIFDMDNTLLHSRIDFAAMKRDVYDLLLQAKALSDPLDLTEHSTSTMIAEAKRQGLSERLEQQVWELCAQHELKGMEGAGLEPGAADMLSRLDAGLVLTIVTNNAYNAAMRALEDTGILDCFHLVIAREQMSALKPSPSGFQRVLEHYSHIAPECWLSIGDSWIDGRASMLAGVPFVSYRTPVEALDRYGIVPIGRIEALAEMPNYLNSYGEDCAT